MFRLISLATSLLFLAIPATATPAVPVTFLTNPGIYTPTPSSNFSDFAGQEVENLFDADNASLWAIDGYLGNNPQGRDEGWISVTLDQSYLITQLRFAPRKPTGATDSIDHAYIWVSNSPFGVDVTSAASTTAFLQTPTGGTPNLTLGPFADFADTDYPFASTQTGKYLLARFVNTSDGDNNRNLGGRTFLIGQVGTIPEPSTLALLTIISLAALPTRRRRKQKKAKGDTLLFQ
jgi:hypothetical protein